MIVKMIQDLVKRMEAKIEKMKEMFNKELEELENRDKQYKTEMKNTREGINSRITEVEEWISDLEDKRMEITAVEQSKEKRMKKNEGRPKDHLNNIKSTYIQNIGVSEGEERERKDQRKYLKRL